MEFVVAIGKVSFDEIVTSAFWKVRVIFASLPNSSADPSSCESNRWKLALFKFDGDTLF